MKTVTIKYCYGDHQELISIHRTDSDEVAIERAIAKHFGKCAGFHRDNGISTATTQYGQIGHYSNSAGCYTMDTGRVYIRVK
ncbi:hypothetical protein D9M71_312130 [compost metagenome]